ncbi:MAG: sensor histidine kinase [Cyclobacteriaceae bacterium]
MSISKFGGEYIVKLKALFDNPVVGLMILDKDGIIESINKVLAKQMGGISSKIEGTHISNYLDDNSNDLFKNYRQEISCALDQKFSSGHLQLQLKSSRENDVMELALSASLVESELFFVGLSKDICHEKKLQHKLKKQQKDREQDKIKLAKAEELIEVPYRLVSLASHEFHSPLAGIITSLNLIHRYIQDKEMEWEQFPHSGLLDKHFELLNKSVSKLQNLVSEFLSIGNIQSGNVKMHKSEFRLNEFFRDHEQFARNLISPQRKLEYSIKDGGHLVCIDKHMLESILNNILSNAVKYSKRGSKIIVEGVVNDNSLNISIKDEGRGIPKADQENIFQHFYRAGNTGSESGTGLGLSIAQHYTKLLGGKLGFESSRDDGQGTTFYINIPIL